MQHNYAIEQTADAGHEDCEAIFVTKAPRFSRFTVGAARRPVSAGVMFLKKNTRWHYEQ